MLNETIAFFGWDTILLRYHGCHTLLHTSTWEILLGFVSCCWRTNIACEFEHRALGTTFFKVGPLNMTFEGGNWRVLNSEHNNWERNSVSHRNLDLFASTQQTNQ